METPSTLTRSISLLFFYVTLFRHIMTGYTEYISSFFRKLLLFFSFVSSTRLVRKMKRQFSSQESRQTCNLSGLTNLTMCNLSGLTHRTQIFITTDPGWIWLFISEDLYPESYTHRKFSWGYFKINVRLNINVHIP